MTREQPHHDFSVPFGGRPTRVLVPLQVVESSDRAIPHAAALATRLGCPLTLFAWHWDEHGVDALHGRLGRLAREVQPTPDVEVVRSQEPVASRAVLDAARRRTGTLICMATHARTGVGATILGSTAEELLRRTTEPVVLVGPRADQPGSAGPVVVCVDGSETSAQAVPVAVWFAVALDVPLEVVTVADQGAARATGPSADTVDAGYVAGLAHDAGPEVAWEVLHGDEPAKAVADHVRDRRSFLVMATHGRTGLDQVVTGSVALRIVNASPCPVLAVRPAGLR